MKRVRLTKRMAADGSIPYPGNVNQPGRTDPDWEQYHTFEQQVNHELPDMRTEWKNDSRDDIGFGVPEANPPTVASVRIAANKAVRIAVLLLGEKVSDSVIEAQARDLMALSQESMDRTLDRFAKTQKFYAEDEDEKDEKEASKKADDDDDDDEDEGKEAKSKKSSKELADKGSVVPPAISLKETEVKAEDKKDEEKPAEVKAEDKKDEEKPAEKKAEKKEMPDFIKEKIEEKKDKEDKKAADEAKDDDKKVEARLAKIEAMIASLASSKVSADEKKDDKPADEKKAADEKDEGKKDDKEASKKADEDEDKKEDKAASKKADEDDDEKDEKKEASVRKAGPNEMDIELTGSMDDELPADPAADAQLASLFEDGLTAAEDEEEKDDAEKKAKAKKAGIKKLGGQPKVAAQSGAPADISSIWESAPDVSEVFK